MTFAKTEVHVMIKKKNTHKRQKQMEKVEVTAIETTIETKLVECATFRSLIVGSGFSSFSGRTSRVQVHVLWG